MCEWNLVATQTEEFARDVFLVLGDKTKEP